ncbi:MAG: tRNA (guanosine(37)-N1)-methyltransferase TrmD [Lachnospiraceae bacterium]|nr:tRNA (guanosine(37)-N1)-methyltransferase TrmD [Lachnospiraceae bacterium]
MNYHVLTLFPEMIEQGMGHSITGRAIKNEHIHLNVMNIRDFTENKHRKVDDYPYGGGAGMVMQPQPVYASYEKAKEIIQQQGGSKKTKVIYLTPQGRTFNQEIAKDLAKEENLIFLCGHYEGIDERVLEEIVDENISIGDYVLTGGELAALVMMDAIARLVPEVLHNDISAEIESFSDGLLEYPQYTRPVEWHGKKVPEILLSGHHANIEAWRKEQSYKRTLERRPDLLENN